MSKLPKQKKEDGAGDEFRLTLDVKRISNKSNVEWIANLRSGPIRH